MTPQLIEHVTVTTPNGLQANGSVLIEGPRIVAVNPDAAHLPADVARVDGGGMLLTPGLIDVHTHGIHTCLYERSPDDLLAGGPALAQYGVTCVLPTLYRVMNRPSLSHLATLADALGRVTGVSMPGRLVYDRSGET